MKKLIVLGLVLAICFQTYGQQVESSGTIILTSKRLDWTEYELKIITEVPVIVDYTTLCETSLNELNSSVKKYIAMGWQPYGGVTFSLTNGSTYTNTHLYVQVLVKYKK